MAMTALSAQVCEEILEDFRQRRLAFPDTLLQELAGNYGLDATCDIDPLDIVEIVSKTGRFDVFSGGATSQQLADGCLSDLLIEAEAKGIKLGCVAGALLVVKQTNMRFNTFVSMHSRLMDSLHPRVQLFQAMYQEISLDEGVDLKLILTGIDTLEEFVGPRNQNMPLNHSQSDLGVSQAGVEQVHGQF